MNDDLCAYCGYNVPLAELHACSQMLASPQEIRARARRRPRRWYAPAGFTLSVLGGVLIGLGVGPSSCPEQPSAPVEKVKPEQVRVPLVAEPAWVHTCVGLPTDTGCP
jgi:hypothetical protein